MSIESVNINLQQQSRIEKTRIWMHEHPTTVKVLKVAGFILGVGLLAALPVAAPVLGTGIVVGIAITGSFLTLISAVAFLALNLIVPPHHDMRNHVFKPDACEGGRLYYDGHVPVLSLDYSDSFKAGEAHGYLCGEAINRLTKRFDFVLHTLGRQPRARRLPNTLATVRDRIPNEYVREIEGIVEGYKRWARQHWWQFPKKLTFEDLLLLHLMPDSLVFQPGAYEPALAQSRAGGSKQAVACSAIIDREGEELTCARNMDWPSFGLAGAYSLVINRKYPNQMLNTVEVGIPGIVGTITGMNSRGLSLAMNVCAGSGTMALRGMPAAIYNRACLERCSDVNEVETFAQNQSPLGAYHLTVADSERAESIHFYQSPNNNHVIRLWEEGQPLSTLNWRYNPQPNASMEHSEERDQQISHFFQHRESRPLEDTLTLPFVNNWLTTHRVVMQPASRRFRVAFDNAFAGKASLQTVSTSKCF